MPYPTPVELLLEARQVAARAEALVARFEAKFPVFRLAGDQAALNARVELYAFQATRFTEFPQLREDLEFIMGEMLSVETRNMRDTLDVLERLNRIYK